MFPLSSVDAAAAGAAGDPGALQRIARRAQVLLQPLCGEDVDFVAYARMTPKGASCVCRLHSASAELVHLDDSSLDTQPCSALPVQLVGDRFVRRMVRVLVATLVRESVLGSTDMSERRLRDIAESRDRLASAPAAPACGLCLVGAGYDGASPQAALTFATT